MCTDESVLQHPWDERGPAVAFSGDIGSQHGLPGAEAVRAGPLTVLQFEQLQRLAPFIRCRYHFQVTVLIGKHQPRCGYTQEPDTTPDKPMQRLRCVVALN